MRAIHLALALTLALSVAGADLPDAYKVIVQRNLFSPSRVPPPPPTATAVVEAPLPVETITLTGVAVLEGRATALFSGSTAGLSGACHPGDSLGTLRIRAVGTGGVSIDADGQEGPLLLAVGQSLRRVQGQPWQWSATAATAAPGPQTAAPSSSAAPETAAPTGDTSDILKRLLERRKKEMGQ